MSIENFNIRNMERMMKAHFNDKHGLVTSYDEKTHKGKVTYMPSGEESGWLPIEESHVGNGWGMLVGLTPGSGQGSGMGGAGSSGDDGSSGGGSGGGGGGAGGGGGQSQYQGDQVIVRFQEGQLNTGKIVKRLHSKVDKPPKVKSGEMLHMHSLGGRMFFDEKGQVHMYDKTSKQDDQMGQGGSGGGSSSGGGGSGGPSPLKGPPPSEPQSVHLMWDGKGKSTMTHYQQDQRQSGQDGQDPNSEKSPSPYARRSISGKDMTHDHVTYQEQQSGGSGASGGGAGAGAGGSGSGSGGSGNNMQVEPGKPGSGKDSAMFARVKSDSKKGTHETTMYQKGGQSGSEKMLHKVSMDRGGESITVTHFENGSDNKKFEMKMDGKGGKCSMTAFQGGQEMGSTTWDNSGNIGHKSKGVHSVNAQRMHINCDTHVQGGVNAQGTVTSASGIGAPTVSGSPGSVTGVSGGSKSPLE